MAKVIKQQYGQKTGNGELTVFHFETDTEMVLNEDRGTTLKEDLATLFGNRTFSLVGDVTGMVVAGAGTNVTIETEVGDDSHSHTGGTVAVEEANRVLISASDKSINVSIVTAAELGFLSGVTSGIQAQLNGKAANGHNHDNVYLKQGLLGAVNGIAPLDGEGMIDAQYLPSYVDSTVEGTLSADEKTFTRIGEDSPIDPESGKIYVDTTTNKTYRWSGTRFVQVGGGGVALGETSTTAYRGDRGAAAYNHSTSSHARTDATATAKSNTNGNILIDGSEVVVYAHPTVTVSAGTATQTLARSGTFQAISAITTDTTGHVTGKTTKTYTMPAIPNIQSGSTQPTDQVAGDLWFQTI